MGSMRRMGPRHCFLKIILARLTADYRGWPRMAVDRRGKATIGETGSESLIVNESGKNAQKRAKTCSPLLGALNLELWTERHPLSRFALRRGKGPSHPSVTVNPCGASVCRRFLWRYPCGHPCECVRSARNLSKVYSAPSKAPHFARSTSEGVLRRAEGPGPAFSVLQLSWRHHRVESAGLSKSQRTQRIQRTRK
jgi:hypothetical protein